MECLSCKFVAFRSVVGFVKYTAVITQKQYIFSREKYTVLKDPEKNVASWIFNKV